MVRQPSLRLHKASGQAVVTIAGKDYYLGSYLDANGRKSRSATAKYSRLLAEYFSSDCPEQFGTPKTELTVVEMNLMFRAYAKKRWGDGGSSEFHRYKPILKQLRLLYGQELAKEFQPEWWKAIRSKLDDGTLTRSYVNKQMQRLNTLLRWAVSERIVPAETHHQCKAIAPLMVGRCKSKERDSVKPVDQSIIDKTKPHLNHVVRAMVEFQLLTACRPGEVCKITPAMVDRSGDVWIITLDQHKTAYRGKRRQIFVGPKAQEVLKPFLLRDADSPCFSPAEALKRIRELRHAERTTPLNQGNKPGCSQRTREGRKSVRVVGDRYSTMNYGKSIRYACVSHKLPVWSPNQLRHNAATNIRKEYGLEVASVMLGHSSLVVTEIYAEKDKLTAIETAKKIG